MTMNLKHINTFSKGLGTDFHPDVPLSEFLKKGINGRLYSEGSIMAYKSIKGTTMVYNNTNIKKYLGYLEFDNELIIFVKTTEVYNDTTEDLGYWNRKVNDLEISVPYGAYASTFPLVLYSHTDPLDLLDGITDTQVLYSTLKPRVETEIIADTFACNNIPVLPELQNYILSDITIPNYKVCNLTAESLIPENNTDSRDAIISLKVVNGVIEDDVRWIGLMNWDINRKIIAEGLEESNRTKRVYFTDNLNYFRSFNLRDEKLKFRETEYFDLNKRVLLNQPTITERAEKGQLKSMSVQYAYRLITLEGQVTSFSPFSKVVRIVKNDIRNEFQGGDISEVTNKSVLIETKIPYHTLYDEIEMVAIEYESGTVPTNIISLGVKPSKEIVYFEHFGNESEYENTFTLIEIINKKNRWSYCSSLGVKDNRLLATAVRNEPFPNELKYYEDMFLLKGWDDAGNTHDCLINPQPYNYKYIDPSDTTSYNRIVKTLYTIYEIYGKNTIRLTNTLTSDYVEQIFENTSEDYIEFIEDIFTWLSGISAEITTKFPNLSITQTDGYILFESTDPGTDLQNYIFTNSSKQVITEFEHEYDNLDGTIDPANKVFGAISNGYNKGIGVRLSWQRDHVAVLEKNDSNYDGGNILELPNPNLKRYYKKGEIYRLGIQLFNNGKPLFTIVLGDIQVPDIGDSVSEIDKNGIGVPIVYENLDGLNGLLLWFLEYVHGGDFLISKYKNQFVRNEQLFSEGLLLKAEVRIPCELNNLVDSYQIVHVERTEQNRTILAQGIAAPLMRTTKYKNASEIGIDVVPEVYAKWTLPFKGGPLHEKQGFSIYDSFGENFDDNNDHQLDDYEGYRNKRYLTHRGLFYMDSPDFIYGKISDKNITATNIKVLGALHTDHELSKLPNQPKDTDGRKSFSRRVFNGSYDYLGSAGSWIGLISQQTLGLETEDRNFFKTSNFDHTPYWVDVSVFSEFRQKISDHLVDKTSYIGEGEILSGQAFNLEHSISNNAQTMSVPSWFYSDVTRSGRLHGATGGRSSHASSEISKTSNISTGNRSVIIKSKTNIFTDDFIGTMYAKGVCSLNEGNLWGAKDLVDTHALIELRNNNLDSIYGGRTKYDLSKNQYIPVGEVIPLHKATNQAQITLTEGDTYLSLYLRVKDSYHNNKEFKEFENLQHDYGSSRREEVPGKYWNKGGAWMYAVLLETQVEARYNTEEALYRQGPPFAFNESQKEFINKAYLIQDSLAPFIPRPHRFYDKINMPNVVSASKVKLIGDFYDSWSEFLERDFYELQYHNL